MHQVDMMLEKLLLWVALLVIIIIIIIIVFPSSLLHMQNAFLEEATSERLSVSALDLVDTFISSRVLLVDFSPRLKVSQRVITTTKPQTCCCMENTSSYPAFIIINMVVKVFSHTNNNTHIVNHLIFDFSFATTTTTAASHCIPEQINCILVQSAAGQGDKCKSCKIQRRTCRNQLLWLSTV